MSDKPKGRQGFASMDPARQREIASKGGKAVPPEKRAFTGDRELASAAGYKGGRAVKPENRAFARVPGLAASAIARE